MKYFFLSTKQGNTHLIVAETIDSAREVAMKDNTNIDDLYELKEDTFKDEGFLI